MRTRWVLLRHDMPGDAARGEWHYDLGVERDVALPGAKTLEHRLLTLRIPASGPVPPGCSEFTCERLGDHRAAYLEYEGPTAPGGGSVRRVAGGAGRVVRDAAEGFEIELEDAAGVVRAYHGRPDAGRAGWWGVQRRCPG